MCASSTGCASTACRRRSKSSPTPFCRPCVAACASSAPAARQDHGLILSKVVWWEQCLSSICCWGSCVKQGSQPICRPCASLCASSKARPRLVLVQGRACCDESCVQAQHAGVPALQISALVRQQSLHKEINPLLPSYCRLCAAACASSAPAARQGTYSQAQGCLPCDSSKLSMLVRWIFRQNQIHEQPDRMLHATGHALPCALPARQQHGLVELQELAHVVLQQTCTWRACQSEQG